METDQTSSSLHSEPTFRPPNGFTESFDPPNKTRDNVVQAFVETNGRGYVVLKQLTNAAGDQFWHIKDG